MTDTDLEEKNFQKAGEILCDIWNNISIDNHTVKCSYQKPTDEPKEIDPPNPANIRVIMKERYLPGPRLIKRSTESGVQLASIGEQPVKEKKIYTNLIQNLGIVTLET